MKQTEGGAIGLQLTQAIARIVMEVWEQRIRKLMKENEINVYLIRKYVDDVNLILQALGYGVRWEGGRMRWREEWEEEDRQGGLPRDQLTMREIQKMSNIWCI